MRYRLTLEIEAYETVGMDGIDLFSHIRDFGNVVKLERVEEKVTVVAEGEK